MASDPPLSNSGKGSANRRLSDREVESKQRSKSYVHQPLPVTIPVTALYLGIAWMLLLPATVITTRTLCIMLADGVDGSFWFSPAFWHFSLGAVLSIIWFLFLPRPVQLYVWGHEMTHALFVILSGGKVTAFEVSERGGHVLTDRNNIIIALSPYFVPFYSSIVLIIFMICGLFIDMSQHYLLPWGGSFSVLYALFAFIGITWAFHLCFTIWMIGKDQPDLRINGAFFSFVLIVLVNLLVLSGLFIIAAPGYGPGQFVSLWMDTASDCGSAVWSLIRRAGD